MTRTLVPFLLLSAVAAAPARAQVPTAADETVDISSVKEKMKVVSDGKGHFVAFGPIGSLSEFIFYGDGKTFYRQRVFGGGSNGDIQHSNMFWEPRAAPRQGGSFEFRDKKYTVECGERKTELKLLPEAEAKAMIGAAKFNETKWKWRAYSLARDEEGRYYYVDRQRKPDDNKNFRMYMGPKGNVKLQKMVNVVSDSEGDIFSTKSGTMRLVTGKKEFLWIAGKAKTRLTIVPVEDNAKLIYSELGAYTGEALGTPCDDL